MLLINSRYIVISMFTLTKYSIHRKKKEKQISLRVFNFNHCTTATNIKCSKDKLAGQASVHNKRTHVREAASSKLLVWSINTICHHPHYFFYIDHLHLAEQPNLLLYSSALNIFALICIPIRRRAEQVNERINKINLFNNHHHRTLFYLFGHASYILYLCTLQFTIVK